MGIVNTIKNFAGINSNRAQRRAEARTARRKPYLDRVKEARAAAHFIQLGVRDRREKRLEANRKLSLARRKARQKTHIALHPKDLVCQRYAI